MQAIRDYNIKNADSSLLNFNKDEIIKLLENSYTPDGWLKGALNERQGLFPLEYVRPIHRIELCDLYKVNFSEFNPIMSHCKLVNEKNWRLNIFFGNTQYEFEFTALSKAVNSNSFILGL